MSRRLHRLAFPIYFLVLLGLGDRIAHLFLDYSRPATAHPYYHHGFLENANRTVMWGRLRYRLVTNELGMVSFATGPVKRTSRTTRVLLIGDSFTEGIGYAWQHTFSGKLQKLLGSKVEVLNAAVSSYSPKLSDLKLRFLLEEKELSVDHVIVFVDVSDPQDEILYSSFTPAKAFSLWKKSGNSVHLYLRDHSFLYSNILLRAWYRFRPPRHRLGAEIVDELKLDEAFLKNYEDTRGDWMYDEKSFQRWGRIGLSLAAESMRSLIAMCRQKDVSVTLAVYPWPENIRRDDLEGRQVTYWRKFAKENGVAFLNFFPSFVTGTAPRKTIKEYFIEGDIHWNENGHSVIARKLKVYLENRFP